MSACKDNLNLGSRLWRAFILAVITTLAFNYMNAHVNRYENIQLYLPSNITPQTVTELPYTAYGASGAMEYSVVFNHSAYTSGRFILWTDDCLGHRLREPDTFGKIAVNGIPFPLLQDPRKRCNIRSNTRVDLTPSLHEGQNTLLVKFTNLQGKLGFMLQRLPSPVQIAGYVGITALSLVCIWYFGICRTMSEMILAVALFYFLFWLHYRFDFSYTNDVNSHLDYIRHMAKWLFPYDYSSYESWHPPLYYFVAGRVFEFSQRMDINPLAALRVFSLGLYMLFCYYGLRTLRLVIEKENLAYFIGAMLIVFWPTSILMATRINNDIAQYAAWAAAFFYLAAWYKERASADLQRAIVAVSIAFMIKSNAIIIAAIAGMTILYALYSKRVAVQDITGRDTWFALAFLAFGVLFNLGRPLYMFLNGKKDVIGHLGGGSDGSSALSHYFNFDLRSYIENPFLVFPNEPTFWSAHLKTMLYGEFSWEHAKFAMVLNILMLTFYVFSMGLALRLAMRNPRGNEFFPYLVGAALPVLASIIFYAVKTWLVCQDFRFIFPMLIPLSIVYVCGIESLNQRSPAYWLCVLLGLALPGLGTLFYLGQYWG